MGKIIYFCYADKAEIFDEWKLKASRFQALCTNSILSPSIKGF